MPERSIEFRSPEKPLHVLPDRIIDILNTGNFSGDAPLIKRYEDGSERRSLLAIPEQFGQLGTLEFGAETKVYAEGTPPPHYNRVDFCYHKGEAEVAYMDFRVLPDGQFQLSHRYVEPPFRGKGVGERLLAQSEVAFQSLAEQRSTPVEVRLQGGQRGVLKWFLKQDYVAADAASAQILRDIDEHPERFIFESIKDTDGVEKADSIFRPGTVGRTIKDTVRINLKKVFRPAQAMAA